MGSVPGGTPSCQNTVQMPTPKAQRRKSVSSPATTSFQTGGGGWCSAVCVRLPRSATVPLAAPATVRLRDSVSGLPERGSEEELFGGRGGGGGIAPDR